MKARAPKRRFKLTEFVNPSGQTVFRVSGTRLSGERVRVNMPTREEALAHADQLEIEETNNASAVRLIQTRLSDAQLKDCESAIQRLAAKGFNQTMGQVVDYFLRNWKRPTQAVPVKNAVDEFLADCKRRNLRPQTIEWFGQVLSYLWRPNPEASLDSFSADAVADLIYNRPKTKAVRQANIRRGMLRLFNWAKRKGYVSHNPVDDVEPPRIAREEPEVFDVPTVRRLMFAAQSHKEGALVPFLALATFAAIRPTELKRLTWDDINLETGTVTISSRISKTRGRRIIELVRVSPDQKPNLVEWLEPYALKRTPLVGDNHRKNLRAVKALAGLKRWPQDVLRHTGISAHYALTEHEGKTGVWGGNSPNIIQRHYRALMPKETATAFFDIRPGDAAAKIAKPNFERKTA